jgi:hypothetical protein
MGVLTGLAMRQEEGRALLQQIRENADLSIHEGLINSSKVHQETLIDLAIVHLELSTRRDTEERPLTRDDFLWAIDMIDHLDTLGYEIIKRWRTKP